MTTASLPTDPIAQLWREARSWLADAMHDFLGPAEIARTLARKARAAIKRRILLIEALLMKLLLIEAGRLSGQPAGRSGSSVASAKLGRRVRANVPPASSRQPAAAENPHAPETWRVRFRLRIPPDPRRPPPARPRDASGPRIRDLGRPLLVRDIWREQARRQLIARLHPKPDADAAQRRAQAKAMQLARRFEALRRVFAEPRRAVARLARKLSAFGRAAHIVARRIALVPPPRCKRLGRVFANAIVYGCDTGASFAEDTS